LENDRDAQFGRAVCGCMEFTVEAARFDTCYRYDELTRVLHDYALSRAGCQPISHWIPAFAGMTCSDVP